MQIEIYSDVVCPWCFVGKRRLERALETAGYASRARVSWRPFELNPTMPKSGMDRRVYLEAKFGGAEARRAMEERVAKAGEADGLVFAFDRIERTPNTFDAHRLIWFAGQQGCQDEVAEALFHSYFTNGREIGSLNSLAEIASDCGLSREEVERFLASDRAVQEVQTEEAIGHRLGIRGVPHFILNGSTSISGAQPPDIFVSAFQQAEDRIVKRKEGA
ncbi:MAG TPA: DsbA family oxidoreductase [Nitrospiraceae bacterium]|jgi:predicted DsbA family dithiol-disulfide isomerase|nr:DsbA family oxidoreductase [Nitrospiraceae bacterium]